MKKATQGPEGIPWIGQVVGLNLASERDSRGLTQREAARYLQRMGTDWSHQYVAAIERGRRQHVSLSDLIGLSYAFGVPLSRWVEGAGDARLSETLTSTRAKVRRMLAGGEPSGVKVHLSPEGVGELLEEWSATSAEQHVARRLRERTGVAITPEDVAQISQEHWGRTLDEERDRRIGPTTRIDKASLRALRAQETRRILDELTSEIEDRREPQS